MRISRLIVVALATLVIGALVGGGLALGLQHRQGLGASSSPAPSASIPYPSGAGAPLLRVSWENGSLAPASRLGWEPTFSLYGDGLAIEGPPPTVPARSAVPSLTALRLNPDGVQAVLRQAQSAGLFGPDRRYLSGGLPDEPTENFALTVGSTHRTVAFLSGAGASAANAPASERAARARFAALDAKLADPASWLPPGTVGPAAPYTFASMAAYVTVAPHAQGAAPGPAWPLSQHLASFGRASPIAGYRCGVLTGGDLTRVVSVAKKVPPQTVWTSAGKDYLVVFRPLLPGDTGC